MHTECVCTVHVRVISAGSMVDLMLLESCLAAAEGDGARVGKRDKNRDAWRDEILKAGRSRREGGRSKYCAWRPPTFELQRVTKIGLYPRAGLDRHGRKFDGRSASEAGTPPQTPSSSENVEGRKPCLHGHCRQPVTNIWLLVLEQVLTGSAARRW